MDKQSILESIEKILEKSDIKIKSCVENDEQIVLIVEFSAEKYLKGINNIAIGFCYIPSTERLIAMKPQLYAFGNEDESFKLDITNKINEIIDGKVTLKDSNNTIEYVYDTIAPLDKITEEFVENIKEDIVVSIATLVILMVEKANHEE